MSERDSVHKEIEKLQEEIKEKNKKLASQDGRNKHHDEEVSTKAQCYRMVNLRHLKRRNNVGIFHDFKQFKAQKITILDIFIRKIAKNSQNW